MLNSGKLGDRTIDVHPNYMIKITPSIMLIKIIALNVWTLLSFPNKSRFEKYPSFSANDLKSLGSRIQHNVPYIPD